MAALHSKASRGHLKRNHEMGTHLKDHSIMAKNQSTSLKNPLLLSVGNPSKSLTINIDFKDVLALSKLEGPN